VTDFVQQCYLVDVAAVAGFYPEWLGHGAGVMNYLATPDLPTDAKMTQFDLPGGAIVAGRSGVQKIESWNDAYLKQNVTESIAHAWYDGNWQRGPWEEETVPKFTGEWKHETPAPERYSWSKAPRLEGKPMQVGPLAQVLVGFLTGHELTVKWVKAAQAAVKAIHKIDLQPQHLHSTLGRHAARAIRACMMTELAQKHWRLLVENIGKGDVEIFRPFEFPKGEIRGVGFHEAPRGILSHWTVIRDGKIANYQCVVPSTWNAGPRDGKDQPGPYEASLVGNPIANAELPLEALRTIHSFDPCLACAIHTTDVEGREIARVKVL
jgi:hydrogenase large subunit